MSTRALIVFKTTDGEYRTTYCHFGSPYDNQEMLLKRYPDPVEASRLVAIGYISSICTLISETIADARNEDREEWHSSLEEVRNHAGEVWGEYIYVYEEENERWMIYDPRTGMGEPLAEYKRGSW